jgi:ABC-type spermidine/putrescine transport system permease subunit II
MILFIFSQFISWLRYRDSTEVKKRNTIKLNDMTWLLLMTLGILSTYLLYVTESFYHRFEISYLTHQERFPDVTTIEEYVKMSFQIYAHIALIIVLGIYLLLIYVLPIIKQKKSNKLT